MEKTLRLALVGNPNSGKTTLFNALTGQRQQVGNYPGVTVMKKSGQFFTPHGDMVEILDLPGLYSLSAQSPDEQITRDILLGDLEGLERPQAVICVVDASQLERHLYLATQVAEWNLPVILALSKMDLLEGTPQKLDLDVLSREMGMPIVPLEVINGKGLVELRQAVAKFVPGLTGEKKLISGRRWVEAPALEKGLGDLAERLETRGVPHPRSHALALLGDKSYREGEGDLLSPEAHQEGRAIAKALADEGMICEEVIVKARQNFVADVCRAVRGDSAAPRHFASTSDKWDSLFLHKFWGWVVFSLVMAGLFYVLFKVAEYPMELIDSGKAAVQEWLGGILPENDWGDLVVNGIVEGVGGVIIFLPQIVLFFIFIGLLEQSGYMARAASLADRVMNRVGLSGRSFVPLLGCNACAIPGILAARTISDPRQRLITILVAPFMSCSARLPVYSLLIPALFPSDVVSTWQKAAITLFMYFLGAAGAFFWAWLFHLKLPKPKEKGFFLLELPAYRWPRARDLLPMVLDRAWSFVAKAGTIILLLSVVIWALSTYPKSDAPDSATRMEQSAMGRMGHWIEPAVRPLGYDWKIASGLVTSFAAREVFVSTMGILYRVDEEILEEEEGQGLLRDRLREATHADGRPVFTVPVCAGLMVFYVYAMQCMATLAVVRRETGSWKWPIIQFLYMGGFAWAMAFLVYRGGLLLMPGA